MIQKIVGHRSIDLVKKGQMEDGVQNEYWKKTVFCQSKCKKHPVWSAGQKGGPAIADLGRRTQRILMETGREWTVPNENFEEDATTGWNF